MPCTTAILPTWVLVGGVLLTLFSVWAVLGWERVARKPKPPAPKRHPWTKKDFEDFETLKRMNERQKRA